MNGIKKNLGREKMKKKDRLRMIKESQQAVKHIKRIVQYAEDKGLCKLAEDARGIMLYHKLRIRMLKDR